MSHFYTEEDRTTNDSVSYDCDIGLYEMAATHGKDEQQIGTYNWRRKWLVVAFILPLLLVTFPVEI